ncbi:MAG: exonuclease domain-containing protein [Pseudorhodobacter sp.]|nr:exonuclease domain-containing protein [Pseudorhodobacter sp.]
MLTRLSLRLRVLLFFAALGLGGIAAIVAGLLLAYRRAGVPDLAPAFVQAGLIGGFGVLGLAAAIWYLFDLNMAKPIEGLAGHLRARAHADVAGAVEAHSGRYLGDLAPAASAAALSLSETRNALAEAVARETTRLAAEKARLEALLSDVPVGVLLCSADHQLVFYNSTAVELMGAAASVGPGRVATAGAGPGLDRKLFDYLREGPILHAHARLGGADGNEAASDLICSTQDGRQVLAARMRLLPSDTGPRPGYVLTLRDVTADLALQAQREALLAEMLDNLRRPATNLRTLLEAVDPGAAPAPALLTALQQEAEALSLAVTELARRQDEGGGQGISVSVTRLSDLADGLRARMEGAGQRLEAAPAPYLLRCNGFEIIALLDRLVAGLVGQGAGPAFRLDAVEDGRDILLRLGWTGAPLPLKRLDDWLGDPIDGAALGMTGRSLLAAHHSDIWPETGPESAQALVLPLPAARKEGPRPKPITRAVVYDFDLLGKERNALVADTPLADLTYVVFDTETTGLLPAQGDEIVQIAALRIVNGRRVAGEVFDTLVNPGRPIPAASTEVHGVTEAMVASAPPIAEVGRAFHKFAEGAVLIAHNAPFDMAFLKRHEKGIGAGFDNPVLDTVLLSAVVFGQHETHSLDALCHRLGITIPQEVRHTAIGDTIATAEAFLKMLPMVRARGFETFGQVLTELRRHGRLLKDLN